MKILKYQRFFNFSCMYEKTKRLSPLFQQILVVSTSFFLVFHSECFLKQPLVTHFLVSISFSALSLYSFFTKKRIKNQHYFLSLFAFLHRTYFIIAFITPLPFTSFFHWSLSGCHKNTQKQTSKKQKPNRLLLFLGILCNQNQNFFLTDCFSSSSLNKSANQSTSG